MDQSITPDLIDQMVYKINASIGCDDETTMLVAKTLLQLPKEIQEQVTDSVIFTSGNGIYGRYEFLRPSLFSDPKDAVHLIILILEQVDDESEKLYIIAHEIAHFVSRHLPDHNNHESSEDEADALAEQWGFQNPRKN